MKHHKQHDKQNWNEQKKQPQEQQQTPPLANKQWKHETHYSTHKDKK